jgi:hypothetical protein
LLVYVVAALVKLLNGDLVLVLLVVDELKDLVAFEHKQVLHGFG